jgi:hypothetical protein
MTPDRKSAFTLLICLLLTGCATSLKPHSRYAPPRGAAPTEGKAIDTGELRAQRGNRGDRLGAEVINTELIGDLRSIEINIPIEPDQVDQVDVIDSSGKSIRQSRQAEIVHDYETNNVGIKIQVPNSDNLGFRLRLIDNPDNNWPPLRQQ